MAEYIQSDEPVIFENKTDSLFDVATGIVFRKSGIYEVAISGQRVIVTKVSERKTGRWINDVCSVCKYGVNPWNTTPYCPKCGAKMEEDDDQT